MIELHNVPRHTLIDIEHLGFCKTGSDKIIKECLFVSVNGAWGKCYHNRHEFLLGAMTLVNLKK